MIGTTYNRHKPWVLIVFSLLCQVSCKEKRQDPALAKDQQGLQKPTVVAPPIVVRRRNTYPKPTDAPIGISKPPEYPKENEAIKRNKEFFEAWYKEIKEGKADIENKKETSFINAYGIMHLTVLGYAVLFQLATPELIQTIVGLGADFEAKRQIVNATQEIKQNGVTIRLSVLGAATSSPNADIEVIKALIDNGANVEGKNLLVDAHGLIKEELTVLGAAASKRNADIEVIRTLLDKGHADIEGVQIFRDEKGSIACTVLGATALEKNTDILRELIQKGANPEAKQIVTYKTKAKKSTTQGTTTYTVLGLAVDNENPDVEVVRALLEEGADPNRQQFLKARTTYRISSSSHQRKHSILELVELPGAKKYQQSKQKIIEEIKGLLKQYSTKKEKK